MSDMCRSAVCISMSSSSLGAMRYAKFAAKKIWPLMSPSRSLISLTCCGLKAGVTVDSVAVATLGYFLATRHLRFGLRKCAMHVVNFRVDPICQRRDARVDGAAMAGIASEVAAHLC